MPPQAVRRLLGLPLLWKVLIANSLIIALGAVTGTVITAHMVRSRPDAPLLNLVLVPIIAGILISVVVNLIALRAALTPLRHVRETIDDVRGGQLEARVRLGLLTDPEIQQVGETLNGMLDELEMVRDKLRALSAGIIDAQEEERRRISRELHDDTAQTLTSLLLYAKALEQGDVPPAVREALAELREEVARSLEGVRRMARELRPSALDDLGLPAALEGYTNELARRTGLPVHYRATIGGERLPPRVELALYRIAQEALTNAAKHARAAHVNITLARDADAITLTVQDDGAGFEPDRVLPATGVGLFSMRERAEMEDGALLVRSAPGDGATVQARLPLRPTVLRAPRNAKTEG